MTEDPRADEPDEPGQLLSELARLRRRTRRARHAYWFPLTLFGLIICAAAPLRAWAARPVFLPGTLRRAFAVPAVEPSPLGGLPPSRGGVYLDWYWALALVAGFLLTWLWYRRHARQAGVVTPARGAAVTGVVLAVLVLAVPALTVGALPWLAFADLWLRGTIALLVIAAGLWVLTWSERSPALAAIALVFSVVALVCSLYNVANVLYRLGVSPAPGGPWLADLSALLLPAAVLLAGGLGGWLAQRARRPA